MERNYLVLPRTRLKRGMEGRGKDGVRREGDRARENCAFENVVKQRNKCHRRYDEWLARREVDVDSECSTEDESWQTGR
jgi:hypothetical protein